MTQEPQQYPPAQQPPAAYYQQQPQPPAQPAYAAPAAAKPASSLPPAIGGMWTMLGVGFAALIILIGFIGALISDGKFGSVGYAMLTGGLTLLGVVLLAEILGTAIKPRLDAKK